MRRGLSIAILILVLDQIIKSLILMVVMAPPRVIEVLPVFNLVLAFNRGVSFSMLTSHAGYAPYLLSGLALAVCVGLVFWLRETRTLHGQVGIGLIMGGALGNVVDRLLYGAVVDFLDLHWGDLHWPAFNFADTAISIGALALMMDALFSRTDSR